jgi:hypothetical protein
VYPDFLIIGAQKAGTTWLHRNLRAHPKVWMPDVKEIHYFDEKVHAGGGPLQRLRGDKAEDIRWRRQARSQLKKYPEKFSLGRVRWDLNYFLRKPSDEWYASLFRPGEGRIVGEATPDYSVLGPDEIAHVHHIMPEARIIFMVRNPVERAWSATAMMFRLVGRAMETMTDEELDARLDGRRVRLFTDYLKTLENWGSFFPPEQIFVGFLEDVHLYPEEFMGRLHDFLGTEPSAGYRVVKQKVHSGSNESIPIRSASYLFGAYRDEIGELDRRFGGYASFWNYCAEKMADEPPVEGTLPYPFWETPMWGEWLDGREARLQSGPLSSLLPAGGEPVAAASGAKARSAPGGAKAVVVPSRRRTAANSGARFPDFISIGAQKAGTTWLSQNLQAHPEIWMPEVKELHYFDERYPHAPGLAARLFGRTRRSVRWRRQVRRRLAHHAKSFEREVFLWELKYYAGTPGDGWYASLFEPGLGKVTGEITPSYAMLDRSVVAHVHEIMPKARVLFMMRNPIERAWSQAAMHFGVADVAEGRQTGDVSEEELRRHFGRRGERSRASYMRTLETWGQFYPDDRVFAGFLEDVALFPEELLQRVYDFLGVDPSFSPRALANKLDVRSPGSIPMATAIALAAMHREEIKSLNEAFGGHVEFWLYCADRLLEDPPAGDHLPYPFLGSPMWQDWLEVQERNTDGIRELGVRSGPLSRVRGQQGSS